MRRTRLPGRAAGDEYLELIQALPLRPIRNQDEYDAAGKMLNRLLGRPDGKLSADQRDYVEALALLVEAYDRRHSRFAAAGRTPLETLRYLVAQAHLGPVALGKVLGITHAAASTMLTGHRTISLKNAKTLAAYFKVDVGAFV